MAKTTFGTELCEALGLDPGCVFSIKLESSVGAVDMMTVGLYADGGKYGKVGQVFKKYKIVPTDE